MIPDKSAMKPFILASMLLFVGCAPYTPVIDFGSSPALHIRPYAPDLQACQALAEQRDPAASAVVGAGVGAVFGALLGAIVGGRPGAGVGAGIGGVYGAGGAGGGALVNQQDVVINCLRARGWTVVGR